MTDLYRALQEHLDKMPVGFPKTESGVEIKILKHLFTEKEAEIATFLNFIPESLKQIYRKVKKKIDITIEELEKMLDTLMQKGCLNGGQDPKTGKKYYANAFLAVGMFEYQVGRLTKEFMEDIEHYLNEAWIDEYKRTGIPQMRTIPIEASIESKNYIAQYEDIRALVETRTPITVAECVCRQGKKLIGEGCDSPMETCFQFGSAARIYLNQGLGREITKDEALKILQEAQDAGLVLQPGNAQRPGWICCCCGCCCEILTNAKKLPKPAEMFASNFYSSINQEECIGCETCVEKCPMEAITLNDDDVATVNLDRCIGCGVCVPACPQEAITLKRKEEDITPPRNTMDMYMEIMKKKAEMARDEKEN
ncbi:MAG: ATP-binding protein [Promethearchaeota archaeon]